MLSTSVPYSAECVEEEFCELRLYGVLRSSRSSGPPPVSGESLHHRPRVLVCLASLCVGYIYM